MTPENKVIIGTILLVLLIAYEIHSRKKKKRWEKKMDEMREKEVADSVRLENGKFFSWLQVHAEQLELLHWPHYKYIEWTKNRVPESPMSYEIYRVRLDDGTLLFSHTAMGWRRVKFIQPSPEEKEKMRKDVVKHHISVAKQKHKLLPLWRKPSKAVWPSPKHL